MKLDCKLELSGRLVVDGFFLSCAQIIIESLDSSSICQCRNKPKFMLVNAISVIATGWLCGIQQPVNYAHKIFNHVQSSTIHANLRSVFEWHPHICVYKTQTKAWMSHPSQRINKVYYPLCVGRPPSLSLEGELSSHKSAICPTTTMPRSEFNASD